MDITNHLVRTWRAAVGLALATVLAVASTGVAQDVPSPATVDVRLHDQLGQYLVDGDGMTIYAFVDTTMDRGPDRVTEGVRDASPSCTEACADAWPPFLTDGAPEAEGEVEAELLYSTERADGSTQVTYNGWPLYFFVSDQTPGDATGQGIAPPSAQAYGATWYMISPDGSLISDQPTVDTAPGDGDGGDGGNGDDGGGGGYY